jgi:hypothetical protein
MGAKVPEHKTYHLSIYIVPTLRMCGALPPFTVHPLMARSLDTVRTYFIYPPFGSVSSIEVVNTSLNKHEIFQLTFTIVLNAEE